ncbi:MAG: LTA synthase family protein [bacterium]|nr:LTA synthase family protein [bacterium]
MKRLAISFLLLWLPFGLARWALLLIYPQSFDAMGFDQLTGAFLRGLVFDFSSIAVFGAVPFLAYFLPGLSRYKSWSALWHLVLAAGSVALWALLVIDLVYFGRVQRHLTFELGLLEGDWGLMARMVGQGFRLQALFFALLVASWLYAWWRLWQVPLRPFGWKRWGALLLLLIFLGRGGWGSKPLAVIDAYQGGDSQSANLVLNGLFTTSHALLMASEANHNHFEPAQAFAQAFPEADRQAKFPLLRQGQGPRKGLNLVFILVESLSSYYIDALGEPQFGVTPFLDDLISRSLVYTEFYASGQRSLEGIQISLTGVPSLEGQPNIGQGFQTRFQGLGHLAKINGYQTLYVQAMMRQSFRGESIAGATGFEHYYGQEDIPLLLDYPDPSGAPFGWDYETLQFSLEKMKDLQKPFAAYLVTSTTHEPYPRLQKRFEKYPPSSNEESGFLNSLAYADWSLKRFFEEASKEPWYGNTLFVITADHGLALYNNKQFLEYFRTPLILFQPGVTQPERRTNLGSQLDLIPTLVEAMGWTGPYATMGQSLLGPGPGYAMAKMGDMMVLINKEGYIRHNLDRVVESSARPEGSAPLALETQAAMETQLLSLDQTVFDLLQENRWFP